MRYGSIGGTSGLFLSAGLRSDESARVGVCFFRVVLHRLRAWVGRGRGGGGAVEGGGELSQSIDSTIHPNRLVHGDESMHEQATRITHTFWLFFFAVVIVVGVVVVVVSPAGPPGFLIIIHLCVCVCVCVCNALFGSRYVGREKWPGIRPGESTSLSGHSSLSRRPGALGIPPRRNVRGSGKIERERERERDNFTPVRRPKPPPFHEPLRTLGIDCYSPISPIRSACCPTDGSMNQ